MPESSKKLYYHKDGTTKSVKLYDSITDTNNQGLAIQDTSSSLYAAIGTTADSNASDIRLQRLGTTWAVLFEVLQELSLFQYIEGTRIYDILDTTEEGIYPVTVDVNNVALGTTDITTIAVASGENISINATPVSGYTLSSWTINSPAGSTTNTGTPLNITVDYPLNITANFAAL